MERTHIEQKDGRPQFTEDGGKTWEALDPGCIVSMNCWAFPAGTLDSFEEKFRAFLRENGGSQKAEFYLPFVVNEMMAAGEADVRVLPTGDKWYGMTYAEDKQKVIDAIAAMTAQGVYPERLWKA